MAVESHAGPAPVVRAGFLARLWRLFIEPPAWMTDPEQRRRSRLLATMTLPILVIVALSVIVIPDSPTYPKLLSLGLLLFFGLINYLSRTRLYLAAALLMMAVFTVLPYYQMLTTGGIVDGAQIVWGVIAVLVAHLLLNRTATVVTVIITIGFPLLVAALYEEATFLTYSRDLFVIALTFVLTQIYAHQRDLLEADRQSELRGLNAALEASAREAREAVRLKDLFLATMSHELRTPLNAIIGFLSLMIYTGNLQGDNLHMTERSMVNAERLLSLINNVLDLSRIAAGRLEIIPVTMSPSKLADAVRADMELQVKEKGLELNIGVDPTLPATIYHDEERLTQMITNLIGNALKFTEQGRIDFALRRNGDRLVVEVRDTGIGIPPAKQALIFDEFTQADTGYARKFGGAGLGLSIVKRMAILMNGSVKVNSDVDQGSTFTIDLPLDLPKPVKKTGPLKEKAG